MILDSGDSNTSEVISNQKKLIVLKKNNCIVFKSLLKIPGASFLLVKIVKLT